MDSDFTVLFEDNDNNGAQKYPMLERTGFNSGSTNLFIATCDYEGGKKRNAIEFLTRSALRASRFKTERTEKNYTERNQGDLTGTNSCINWCSFI